MKYGLLKLAVKNLNRKIFRTAVLVFSVSLLVRASEPSGEGACAARNQGKGVLHGQGDSGQS